MLRRIIFKIVILIEKLLCGDCHISNCIYRLCGAIQMLLLLLLLFFIPSGVKIPRVKSKVKSKRKAEVVTPIIIIITECVFVC